MANWNSGGAAGTAKAKFMAIVDEFVKDGMDRASALMKAAAENPELHRRMVEERNPKADLSRFNEWPD